MDIFIHIAGEITGRVTRTTYQNSYIKDYLAQKKYFGLLLSECDMKCKTTNEFLCQSFAYGARAAVKSCTLYSQTKTGLADQKDWVYSKDSVFDFYEYSFSEGKNYFIDLIIFSMFTFLSQL